MTLGNAAAARVRLIVWCRDCAHQFEPDPHPSPGVALGSRRSLYVRAWQSADSLLERTGFELAVPPAKCGVFHAEPAGLSAGSSKISGE